MRLRCAVRLIPASSSPPQPPLRATHSAYCPQRTHNISQTHTLTQNKQQKHINYFLSYLINPPSQLLGSSYPHPSPETQFKHPLSSLLPATTTKINTFWSYTPKPGAPPNRRAGLPCVSSSVTRGSAALCASPDFLPLSQTPAHVFHPSSFSLYQVFAHSHPV